MIECFVMGDSIATGIAQARPECATMAKVGITSDKWYRSYPNFKNETYKVTVISLGTNDGRADYATLHKIRSELKSHIVFWVLPSAKLKPTQREAVQQVSNNFNDKTVDISRNVGADGIHPSTLNSYRDIANNTR